MTHPMIAMFIDGVLVGGCAVGVLMLLAAWKLR